MGLDQNFWKGKRILITGHSCFKGSWLALFLSDLGSELYGLSDKVLSPPSMFEVAKISSIYKESAYIDIRNQSKLTKFITKIEPEIIFHLAAQSIVQASYTDPVETYTTNLIGTLNIFESIRNSSSVRSLVNVTSDKCYENKEQIWGYREIDSLGGFDPYSSSKACSEILTNSYRNSFFSEMGIGVASARSGNVIGGGDWASNRLVPDAIRALISDKSLRIRSPISTRPWQHVFEPLMGYMLLAQNLYRFPEKYSGPWNFGPNNENEKTVAELIDEISNLIPIKIDLNKKENTYKHEANFLKLDSSKSRKLLNWSPLLDFSSSVKITIAWYNAWINGEQMREFSHRQINDYLKLS